MVELKANMKRSYKDGDFSCLGCGDKASVEDQSHVIRYPAYSDIMHQARVGHGGGQIFGSVL